jgi:hypothetical protein
MVIDFEHYRKYGTIKYYNGCETYPFHNNAFISDDGEGVYMCTKCGVEVSPCLHPSFDDGETRWIGR